MHIKLQADKKEMKLIYIGKYMKTDGKRNVMMMILEHFFIFEHYLKKAKR